MLTMRKPTRAANTSASVTAQGSAAVEKPSSVDKPSTSAQPTPARNEELTELDEAMLSVWRQVLVERGRRVQVGAESYSVRRTAKRGLAQVDFEVAGRPIRGLEQNSQTNSRWAQLARKGAKVMQFLSGGRYIAAIADGKITHYSRR